MRKALKDFIELFDIITKVPSIIFGIVGFLALFTAVDKKLLMIMGALLIFGSLIITAAVTAVKYYKIKKDLELLPDDHIIATQLKDALKKWYDNEEYGEVVKFGRTVGRALYLSACYDTRIEIGEMLKESAEHQEDKHLMISVLLDDLGWTKFLCKKDDAEDEIKAGLALAESENDYKAISKAYRHLFAIEVSKWKNPPKAHEYLQKAYEACEKMSAGREKERTYAGLYFAESELNFKEQNYDKAKEMAILCEEKRKSLHETDRQVKYYALIGKIELFRPGGNVKVARDYFRKGIEESESANRIDEMVKNAYGYACCCYKLRETRKIERVAGEIIKQYGQIQLYSEDELLRKTYKELKENTNH